MSGSLARQSSILETDETVFTSPSEDEFLDGIEEVEYEPEPEPETPRPTPETDRKDIVSVEIQKTEKRSLLVTDDEKCNYICGSSGSEEDIKRLRENWRMISTEGMDYAIVTKAQQEYEKQVIDKRNTMSFMSVHTVEEGIEWYRTNFPKIPEELYPIMSRWNFGDLNQITKKDVKNDKKRVKQGKKPKVCQTLQVKKGPVVVEF